VSDSPFTQVVTGQGHVVAGGDVHLHTHTAVPVQSDEFRNLTNLLNKVRTFWIEGVLENSVHHAVLLELGKQTAPEAVEHPWERIQELPNGKQRILPSHVGIREIFTEATSSLLILGDPGSGKTTTLLELARDLLSAAQTDPLQPVPIVLNLSTWAALRQELDEWLSAELVSRYQVPTWLGAHWIKNQRLLPLLDGLDEVQSEHRVNCVEAIHRFVQTCGVPGLVVTCRTEEYHDLSTRMRMGGAIRLLALNDTQVDSYLAAAGPALSSFAAVLATDGELRTLARSPLMLSIMSLAFYEVSPDEIASPSGHMAARRQQLFGKYVDRMFERRKASVTDGEAIRQSLEWLAFNLQQRSETVFRIEGLQPTWLSTLGQLWIYAVVPGFAARLVLYIVVILTTGVAFYREVSGVVVPMVGNSVFASVLALVCVLLMAAVFDVLRLERQFVSNSADQAISPLSVLLNVVTMGLLGDLKGRRPHPSQDIRTVEALRWSSPRALRAGRSTFFGYGVLAGLSLALSAVVIVPLTPLAVYLAFLAMGITVMGLLAGAITALTYGMDGGVIETKIHPNQGIFLTARNAVVGGLIVAMLAAIASGATGLLFSIDTDVVAKIIVLWAVALGMSCSLCLGGFGVLQHYTLRWILSQSGRVPFRCHNFLEQSVKLLFLQRVGGGYIFIHRLLMDYFAARFAATGAAPTHD
jgi:DNA polymerase III delta prime subunit